MNQQQSALTPLQQQIAHQFISSANQQAHIPTFPFFSQTNEQLPQLQRPIINQNANGFVSSLHLPNNHEFSQNLKNGHSNTFSTSSQQTPGQFFGQNIFGLQQQQQHTQNPNIGQNFQSRALQSLPFSIQQLLQLTPQLRLADQILQNQNQAQIFSQNSPALSIGNPNIQQEPRFITIPNPNFVERRTQTIPFTFQQTSPHVQTRTQQIASSPFQFQLRELNSSASPVNPVQIVTKTVFVSVPVTENENSATMPAITIRNQDLNLDKSNEQFIINRTIIKPETIQNINTPVLGKENFEDISQADTETPNLSVRSITDEILVDSFATKSNTENLLPIPHARSSSTSPQTTSTNNAAESSDLSTASIAHLLPTDKIKEINNESTDFHSVTLNTPIPSSATAGKDELHSSNLTSKMKTIMKENAIPKMNETKQEPITAFGSTKFLEATTEMQIELETSRPFLVLSDANVSTDNVSNDDSIPLTLQETFDLAFKDYDFDLNINESTNQQTAAQDSLINDNLEIMEHSLQIPEYDFNDYAYDIFDTQYTDEQKNLFPLVKIEDLNEISLPQTSESPVASEAVVPNMPRIIERTVISISSNTDPVVLESDSSPRTTNIERTFSDSQILSDRNIVAASRHIPTFTISVNPKTGRIFKRSTASPPKQNVDLILSEIREKMKKRLMENQRTAPPRRQGLLTLFNEKQNLKRPITIQQASIPRGRISPSEIHVVKNENINEQELSKPQLRRKALLSKLRRQRTKNIGVPRSRTIPKKIENIERSAVSQVTEASTINLDDMKSTLEKPDNINSEKGKQIDKTQQVMTLEEQIRMLLSNNSTQERVRHRILSRKRQDSKTQKENLEMKIKDFENNQHLEMDVKDSENNQQIKNNERTVAPEGMVSKINNPRNLRFNRFRNRTTNRQRNQRQGAETLSARIQSRNRNDNVGNNEKTRTKPRLRLNNNSASSSRKVNFKKTRFEEFRRNRTTQRSTITPITVTEKSQIITIFTDKTITQIDHLANQNINDFLPNNELSTISPDINIVNSKSVISSENIEVTQAVSDSTFSPKLFEENMETTVIPINENVSPDNDRDTLGDRFGILKSRQHGNSSTKNISQDIETNIEISSTTFIPINKNDDDISTTEDISILDIDMQFGVFPIQQEPQKDVVRKSDRIITPSFESITSGNKFKTLPVDTTISDDFFAARKVQTDTTENIPPNAFDKMIMSLSNTNIDNSFDNPEVESSGMNNSFTTQSFVGPDETFTDRVGQRISANITSFGKPILDVVEGVSVHKFANEISRRTNGFRPHFLSEFNIMRNVNSRRPLLNLTNDSGRFIDTKKITTESEVNTITVADNPTINVPSSKSIGLLTSEKNLLEGDALKRQLKSGEFSLLIDGSFLEEVMLNRTNNFDKGSTAGDIRVFDVPVMVNPLNIQGKENRFFTDGNQAKISLPEESLINFANTNTNKHDVLNVQLQNSSKQVVENDTITDLNIQLDHSNKNSIITDGVTPSFNDIFSLFPQTAVTEINENDNEFLVSSTEPTETILDQSPIQITTLDSFSTSATTEVIFESTTLTELPGNEFSPILNDDGFLPQIEIQNNIPLSTSKIFDFETTTLPDIEDNIFQDTAPETETSLTIPVQTPDKININNLIHPFELSSSTDAPSSSKNLDSFLKLSTISTIDNERVNSDDMLNSFISKLNLDKIIIIEDEDSSISNSTMKNTDLFELQSIVSNETLVNTTSSLQNPSLDIIPELEVISEIDVIDSSTDNLADNLKVIPTIVNDEVFPIRQISSSIISIEKLKGETQNAREIESESNVFAAVQNINEPRIISKVSRPNFSAQFSSRLPQKIIPKAIESKLAHSPQLAFNDRQSDMKIVQKNQNLESVSPEINSPDVATEILSRITSFKLLTPAPPLGPQVTPFPRRLVPIPLQSNFMVNTAKNIRNNVVSSTQLPLLQKKTNSKGDTLINDAKNSHTRVNSINIANGPLSNTASNELTNNPGEASTLLDGSVTSPLDNGRVNFSTDTVSKNIQINNDPGRKILPIVQSHAEGSRITLDEGIELSSAIIGEGFHSIIDASNKNVVSENLSNDSITDLSNDEFLLLGLLADIVETTSNDTQLDDEMLNLNAPAPQFDLNELINKNENSESIVSENTVTKEPETINRNIATEAHVIPSNNVSNGILLNKFSFPPPLPQFPRMPIISTPKPRTELDVRSAVSLANSRPNSGSDGRFTFQGNFPFHVFDSFTTTQPVRPRSVASASSRRSPNEVSPHFSFFQIFTPPQSPNKDEKREAFTNQHFSLLGKSVIRNNSPIVKNSRTVNERSTEQRPDARSNRQTQTQTTRNKKPKIVSMRTASGSLFFIPEDRVSSAVNSGMGVRINMPHKREVSSRSSVR